MRASKAMATYFIMTLKAMKTTSVSTTVRLLRATFGFYSKGNYTKLTDFNGEDRTPVWAGNSNTYYYLSEEDGTFNVYKRNIDGSGKRN